MWPQWTAGEPTWNGGWNRWTIIILRFLLGYAEYNSGLRKLGLTNMKRAADVVPLEWSAVFAIS